MVCEPKRATPFAPICAEICAGPVSLAITKELFLIRDASWGMFKAFPSSKIDSALKFLSEWILRLDYVNTSMRSIKKIQTDCQLLFNCMKNPQYLQNIYNGILFDKVQRNSGSYTYNVFIEELNIISRITTHVDESDYSKCKLKLFLFETEDNVKKKVKLQIVL